MTDRHDAKIEAGTRRGTAEMMTSHGRRAVTLDHGPERDGPTSTLVPDQRLVAPSAELMDAITRVSGGDAQMQEEAQPCLYVIMRTDLDSMNRGKMIAQGTHAANAMVAAIRDLPHTHPVVAMLSDWENSTDQGFGVTIVMDGGPMSTVEHVIHQLNDDAAGAYTAGIVHDPSYPIRDGCEVHKIPLNTCGWIFGDRRVLIEQFQFELLA